MSGNRFIGRGWGFPVRVGGNGGIELVGETREIEEAIRLIVGTSPGERRMRPAFGCRIHELVFAPANAATAGQAERYVLEALARWEPRIKVEDVTVDLDPGESDAARLLIAVHYTIKSTKDERTLVYPFYMISPEDAPI